MAQTRKPTFFRVDRSQNLLTMASHGERRNKQGLQYRHARVLHALTLLVAASAHLSVHQKEKKRHSRFL